MPGYTIAVGIEKYFGDPVVLVVRLFSKTWCSTSNLSVIFST